MSVYNGWEDRYKVDANGCHIWVGAKNSGGYGHMRIDKAYIDAHRVAWVIANGEIPAGYQILHKCDNKACVNPNHLFLGTQKDNIQDACRKNRLKVPVAKLSEQQISEIRTSVEKSSKLARKYGVTRGMIWRIRAGKSWQWVA